MIKKDEYGTYGHYYACPECGKEHGPVYHHITEQLPILCDGCLISDSTDINLRIKTLIYYVVRLQKKGKDMEAITNGLRIIK